MTGVCLSILVLPPCDAGQGISFSVCMVKIIFINQSPSRAFPGGPVVKNLPSSAGDVGSIPGRGTKIPHAAGQLSLRAITTDLACLN